MISFEEFKKVELKIGKILEAERVDGSEKLLKLKVDFGESEPRQVISGIAKSYKLEKLVGKEFLFTTNLEPRNIMGFESQAMILATVKKGRKKSVSSYVDGNRDGDEVILMKPIKKVKPGSELG